ncbi:sigma-54-dependent Fis family transcriptional regulator [Desulfospira joergensenii]|uniref:sigma-54-dependent Fis family transcriptional regulator n=1 Tax=Desulfospira joergensenii TaxID=53329 RepID=UPI0003B68738|nr:sigma-54-dependent Fis family transcriptional regulator [Desulfospira joergensenii]
MTDHELLSLVQKIPVALYRCSGNPVWKVEFFNNGINYISGYSLSYFSGDTPHDYTSIVHPDDREIRKKTILNRTRQGKAYSVEYRISHADGRLIWVREEGQPEEGQPVVDDKKKALFTGTISDVTRKKRALGTFRLNESRLNALLDLNQMTGMPLNEITGHALEKAIELTSSKVGYCAFVNEDEKIVQMYSWSKMVIRNCKIKHKQKTYHLDDMGLWGEAIRQRKSIIINDYKEPNTHKRGQPEGHVNILRYMNVPIFDQGRIVMLAGVGNKKDPYDPSDVRQVILLMEGMWNIIRRKQIEDNLRESEMKYRSVFEYAGSPSVIIEEDMTISMANLKFEQFSGYPRQDVENQIKFSKLISKENTLDLKSFQKLCTRRSVDAPFEYECKFVDQKGLEKDIAIKLGILPGQKRCIASFFDVTESKKAEKRLKEQQASLWRENILLKSGMQKRYGFGQIVGKSSIMQEVYNHIIEAGTSEANVIVYGESGTGKELVSRAIHDISNRQNGPFVSVNCGAIPDHLLESEFFGSKKGAFTGAYSDRPGHMDKADKGTLFLDEIGELGLHMQVKLLRAIEGNGYTPVGSTEVIKPDVRIIAATNRDLLKQVNEGKMRKDFFYRVHIIPLDLPPLRERKEDIPLLIHHFLQENNLEDKKGHLFTADVIASLSTYDWPGNIRELQNVLHRFISLKRLDFGYGKVESPSEETAMPAHSEAHKPVTLKQAMDLHEKNLILATLEKNNWSRIKSASMLNINRKTLFKKMKAHGVEKPHPSPFDPVHLKSV